MNNLTRTFVAPFAFIAAVVTAACRGGDDAQPGDSAIAAGAEGMAGMQMDRMPAMGGGGSGMQSGAMMAAMRSRMQSMHGASGDSLMRMMPMHRQMAANMLSQMNREMRSMNMTGDAAWTATVDSVRRDLANMPDMSAGELGNFMPAHQRRMMRLMDMHQAMMSDMKM